MTRGMKRVVMNSGLREADIRPPALLSEFKRLSIEDARAFFGDASQLVEAPCVACESDGAPAFSVHGFQYKKCVRCGSLFISPRPTAAALERYYAESRAGRFRVEHYSRDTAKARRMHLLASHAAWIGRLFDEAGNRDARGYADVNTRLPEMFDEIYALGLFDPLLSVAPLCPSFAACEAPVHGTEPSETTGMGVVSAMEHLEHQFSPAASLHRLRDMLADGGLLFIATRVVSGFDLQLLWDKTPYLFVPEHLNLPSVEGVQLLAARCGFEVVELSTPGQLDVEMVRHAVENDPTITLPPFIGYLLENRDKAAHQDFQEFLQKHRLSSYLRAALKKL